MKDYSQLNATADQHGFIVAYPQGQNKAWNAGDCCGAPQRQGTDDVGFIRAVIDDLASVACVDPRRVYATGMSNGSMMSHRLACELSDRVAAIAGVSGQLGASYLPTCNPPRRISIMHIHGTDDRCAPYDGGVTAGGCVVGPLTSPRVCDASDPPVTDPTNPPPNIYCLGHTPSIPSLLNEHPPVADTIEHWLAHDSCNTSAVSTQVIGAVNVSTYPCADNTELKFYKIIDGGHSWPGGPDSACCEVNRAANTDIDANEEIWKFFSTKLLP
jgi:polyhydroxybutyrate depolymerase